MKKIMCLMVFLALASMAMAAWVPVTSVTCNNPTGTAPYILQSLTVGTVPPTTVTVDKLRFGTTSAGSGTTQANMDDYNLNNLFAGWAYPLQTVLFGGKEFFSTNGSLPDFFLFEAGGNPDDVFIAPIFPDNTQGMPIALATDINATGWGLTGYVIAPTFPQAGQTITGVSWDITAMLDASGNPLSPNAVIKGIRITSGAGIDICTFLAAIPMAQIGQAHTPVPTDMATLVDSTAVTSVSWYSPEQDNLGAFKDDPNIVSVDGYKYLFGTAEPNEFTQPYTLTTAQNFPVTLGYETTYKWRVDTLVTWLVGPPSIVKGYVWKLTTKPFYIAPVLTFNGVVTLQSLLPANLSASVAGNTLPITSRTFTLLTGDVEYPAGAIAVLTDTTTNNLNPTATLTTDKTGKYKVKLVVTDGTTPVEKIAEVLVYVSTDDCAARKAVGGWVKNYYDDNGNCKVTLYDFVPLANAWLTNTGYTTQQAYTGAVNPYVPKSIFDARIEAESVSQTDPNAVSDFPVTDATGIRIDVEPTAMGGGKNLGTTVNGFAQYIINIPAAGTYDLHVNSAALAAGNVMSFGVAGTPALYGSVTGLPYPGWDNWQYTVHPGALTFTSAGPTVVRITWNATSRDLDWFTLVKQ
jgi:hypothetical protein